MNTTTVVPISSEMTDIVLANSKERKAEDLIPETNSRKCSTIRNRLPSLENDST